MADTWLKAVLTVKRIEQSIKEDLSESPAACLTPRACYVLKALYNEDGQKATSLAKLAGIEPTGFTPTLDCLEQAEYIQRRPSPNDRRSVLIYLTKYSPMVRDVILDAIANAETKYGKG